MKKEMLLQEIEEMSAELVSKFDTAWNNRDPEALMPEIPLTGASWR
jgi:hypothetical protein